MGSVELPTYAEGKKDKGKNRQKENVIMHY